MNDEVYALAESVLKDLNAAGMKIATVESCTGGLIIGALTDVPGSSASVDRGFITYSNEAKTELVKVPSELIETHGAVSPEVAEAMARGGLAASCADIAVAVTGIAGPGGSEFKPEGLVCFHVARSDGETIGDRVEFGAIGRANVRRETVRHALVMVSKLVRRP